MKSVGSTKRKGLLAAAGLLCVLVAGLAFSTGAAIAGEAGGEREEYSTPGAFPWIASAAAPEEYEHRLDWLGSGDTVRQVDGDEIVIYDEEGDAVGWVRREVAHDADGTNVPTTLSLVEGDVVVLTVHHREGNPAAGGAPFVYPISGGPGWEGGYFSKGFEMNEPPPPAAAPPPPAPATPTCTVPPLHGLSLRAAKAHLRTANCAIGQVRLAGDATAAKGKVVKQFRPAGTELAAGSPVAVKLGTR